MIAITAIQRDWVLNRCSIEKAFVRSEIGREHFLTLPDGYDEFSNRVLKFNKSIYGLRHSPRVFNQLFISKIVAFGIKQCGSDPCVFRLTSLTGEEVRRVVGVYVNDLIVTGETRRCRELRAFLQQSFPAAYIGCLSLCVGCEYSRDHSDCILNVTQTVRIYCLSGKF